MPIDDTRQIGKYLGNLYNEVFQRRSRRKDSTVALKSNNNTRNKVGLNEKTLQVLYANTVLYKWGPSGNSPETNVSPVQGVWGEGVWG